MNKMKRFLSMFLAVIMLTSVIFTGHIVKAGETEYEKEIELKFSNYDGGFYFTVDDLSKVEIGFYKVDITYANGTSGYAVIEYPSWHQGMCIWNLFYMSDGTRFEGLPTGFTIKEGTVMIPTDVNGSVIPEDTRENIGIANSLSIVCVNGEWIKEPNTVVLSFDYANGNDAYFDVTITAGPDAGKSMSEAYPSGPAWQSTTKGFGYFDTNAGRLILQHLGTGNAEVTEIEIPAGTLFPAHPSTPTATPLYVEKTIKLARNSESGAWEEVKEPNTVVLSFDYADANGAYFDVTITAGPDAGESMSAAYPSGAAWQSTTKGFGYFDTNAGKLILQNLGTNNAEVTEVEIPAGTLFPAHVSTPTATSLYVEKTIKLARNSESGAWEEVEVPHTVSLALAYVDGQNAYFKAEIIEGPDAGNSLDEVYNNYINWVNSDGKLAYIESNGYINFQNWGTQDNTLTELVIEAGTTLSAHPSNPDVTPICIENKVVLMRNEANNWKDVSNGLNRINLTLNYVDGNNAFFDVEIIEGPDAGETFSSAYGDVQGAAWESETKGFGCYANGLICLQGLGLTDESITEVIINGGTLFAAHKSSPTATPLYVEQSIRIVKSGETWSQSILRVGDVNIDDYIDIRDLVALKKLVSENNISDSQKIVADLDGNGRVNKDDCEPMRQRLLNDSLVEDGASNYTIVCANDATENEIFAAREIQYFVASATGADIPITSETSALDSGKCIFVGATKAADAASVAPSYEEVQSNGFVIKTIGDDIYLRGYSDIGTRNSVYEFLDRILQYEFYAHDEIHITRTKNVDFPDLDICVTPDFEWRMGNYGEIIRNSTISNRMRFNSGGEIFVMGYHTHNMMSIIDPKVYDWTSDKYKDWFASTTWKGQTGNEEERPVQLCLSNEDMRNEFTKNLIEIIKDSDVANVMLGQEDNYYSCECTSCAQEYSDYGTNAAVMIKFINKVQADVDTWFAENRSNDKPTRLIMLAYHNTLHPAARYNNSTQKWEPIDDEVVLNANSGVIYAPVEEQYDIPFTDSSKSNIANAHGQILGWKALSDNLFAWTYSLYQSQPMLFFNSFESMQDNYKLLLDNGVRMILDQTNDGDMISTGFGRLKAYVMSKLQWDNSLDMEELIDDFFENYFGDASSTMKDLFTYERDWLNFMHENNHSYSYVNAYGKITDNLMDAKYWPYEGIGNETDGGAGIDESQYNTVSLSYAYVDPADSKNVYFNATITSGPDAGKSLSAAYPNGAAWQSTTKGFGYLDGNRICLQNLGTNNESVIDVVIPAGTLFPAHSSTSTVTPLYIENSVRIFKSNGVWRSLPYYNWGLQNCMSLIEQALQSIEPLKESNPEQYAKLHDRITIESIQFRYILIELYSSKYSATELLEMKQDFKADYNRLGFTPNNTLWIKWGIE